MKKILLSAAIAGLLFSCSDRTQDNITALTDEIKTEAVNIKGETVCTFPDTAFVNAAWMANDRYAFCRTVTGPTGLSAQAYAVQVRDTRTLEQIAGYIHAGNGPFEVISPTVHTIGDTLYVMDFSKGNMFLIPMDDTHDYSGTIKHSYKFRTMRAATYKGRMLALNPYWFDDKKSAGAAACEEPKLFFSDGDTWPYNQDNIFTGNCFQGHLLTNQKEGTIVYVENSYPLVEFYNDTLGLVKSITGPDDIRPEYFDDGSYMFFAKSYGTVYGPVCCDDSYIYLRYDDNLSTEPLINGKMVDGIPTMSFSSKKKGADGTKGLLILVLDWKGKIKGSYRLEGLNDCTAISTTEPGILYASTMDEETEQLSVIRYRLF